MPNPEPESVKQCCATLYGGSTARALLGESFHPGGVGLTLEIGTALNLTGASRLLDVASGRGTSALALAEHFGCTAVGIDLSADNVAEANGEASRRRLETRARFVYGDGEKLPFPDGSFDVVLCECAFCTFPDKNAAATDFARVLKLGGRVAISDLTRALGPLPGLDGLLAWVACIGDARPASEYVKILNAAQFTITSCAARDSCLIELIEQVRGRLLLADVMKNLDKIDLAGFDLDEAKAIANAAARAVRAGALGYTVIIGEKPSP